MFSFLLSVSVNNAWQLCRLCASYATEKLDLLNFNRHLVITYLQRYSSKNGTGLVIDTTDYAADRRVPPEVRYDKVDHMIQSIPKQRRCAERKFSASARSARFLCMLTVL